MAQQLLLLQVLPPVTGTGVLTDNDTITIDGTTVTFTASTGNNLTDLVTLISNAGITNVRSKIENDNLIIEKPTGADITIAGTGSDPTDVGLTAGNLQNRKYCINSNREYRLKR